MKKELKNLLIKLREYDSEAELATDGEYNIIDVSDDPYLDRIILDGTFFSLKNAVLCDKEIGQCHRAVSNILLNETEEGDVLYTGFAKSPFNNEWFTHSFIVNNGKIVESGKILFSGYLGIPLFGQEADDFINYWK